MSANDVSASNYYHVDDEDDDGLNELEKLAGIDKNAVVEPVEKLEISDDELPDYPAATPDAEDNESDRPNSVGAESSYSDFMQQWKNKLTADEDKEGPSDVASNHSKRSGKSNRSGNPADNSPFRDLTSQQTRSLLKG